MRTTRTTRTTRTIAASSLALGLTLTLTPAHANPTAAVDDSACQFTDAKLSKPVVAVGLDKVVRVNVTATAADCDTDYVFVEFDQGRIGHPNDDWLAITGSMSATVDDPTHWEGTVEVEPAFLYNTDAGYDLPGLVSLGDGVERQLGASMILKRQSRIDAGYLPSKIKKNKSFGFGAGLDLANWTEYYYTANEGKKVHLQTSGSRGGKYKTVKTIRTMRGQNGGSLSSTIRLKKTTCFRWVFDGTDKTSAATSYAGCVKVKK